MSLIVGALVSIVHEYVRSGPVSGPLVERTWNAWPPSLSVYDCPLVQAANEPLSTLHSKPSPLPLKEKPGEPFALVAAGLAVIAGWSSAVTAVVTVLLVAVQPPRWPVTR